MTTLEEAAALARHDRGLGNCNFNLTDPHFACEGARSTAD
jgi:hypothetical protein